MDTSTRPTYATGTCTVTACASTDANGTAATDASGVCRLTCNNAYSKNASGVCTACPTLTMDTSTRPTYATGTCTVTACASTDANGTAATDASGVCRLTCNNAYSKNASGVCTACTAGDTGTTPTYTNGTCTVTACASTDANGTAALVSGVCRLTCRTNYTKNTSGVCVYCPSGYTVTTSAPFQCYGYPLCSATGYGYFTPRDRCESSNFSCPVDAPAQIVNNVTMCTKGTPSCAPYTGRTVVNVNSWPGGGFRCITQFIPTCPSGSSYKANSYNSALNQATCRGPATYVNINCPSGSTKYGGICYNGTSGTCCTTSACTTTMTPTCPSGYVLGYDQWGCGYYCYTFIDTVVNNWIPSGAIGDPRLDNNGVSQINALGQCVYDYGAPACPSGSSNTNGICVSGSPSCPGGGTYDTAYGVCYVSGSGGCPTSDFSKYSYNNMCIRTL